MQVAIFILVVLVFVAVSGALVRLVRVPLPVLQIAIGAALAWRMRGIHVETTPSFSAGVSARPRPPLPASRASPERKTGTKARCPAPGSLRPTALLPATAAASPPPTRLTKHALKPVKPDGWSSK
ncbi:hypothetical protein NKH36_23885 [Mesorhizobium sp. M1312]|uniref:hypothetical protein n=1 Tax=unclassified Mesorhizobium TaxID=325217 RepID=UPI00333D87E0